jgi:hypothetical protein
MAWNCGAGHYFDFLICHRLILNINLFPVTTAKLLGELYNNRRSAVQRHPRFAYSFMSLLLPQCYWRCNSYSAYKRNAANRKNPEIFGIGAANVPHFTYRHDKYAPLCLLAQGAGRSAAPITSRVALHLFL